MDNGNTALSGGQPHPGSPVNARGQVRHAIDLAGLVREAGVEMVQVVDVDGRTDIRSAIQAGMEYDGVAVVIARGECVQWKN